MPKIAISLSKEENKHIEIYKAKNGLSSKEESIKRVIQKYFKIRKK